MIKAALVAVLVLAMACLAWCAPSPLDADPTNPIKSEDFASPGDPEGFLLLKKKLLLGKLLLLG